MTIYNGLWYVYTSAGGYQFASQTSDRDISNYTVQGPFYPLAHQPVLQVDEGSWYFYKTQAGDWRLGKLTDANDRMFTFDHSAMVLPTAVIHGPVAVSKSDAIRPTKQYPLATARKTISEPTDTTDSNKLSVVFFQQSTLNTIASICKPSAGGNEFQVHYRSLIGRLKGPDGAELIVTFPTAFYNFPQKVSPAYIDYHLGEAQTAAQQVKGASEALINSWSNQSVLVKALQQLGFELYESNSGSIHRHPSDFSFSGTDRDKDPSHPGVIYRSAKATDHVQTDSVIYLPNGNVKLVTTETYIVNVQPSADGGVSGTYAQVPTVSYVLQDESGTAKLAAFLGKVISSDYLVVRTLQAGKYSLPQQLSDAYKDAPLTPVLEGIDPKNITSAYGSTVYAGGTNAYGFGRKYSRYYDMED